jgi:hypothetical protein
MPEPGQDYAKKKILEEGKAADECDALDTSLAELRAAYEQHFLGLDRHPPQEKHRAIKRRIADLKSGFIRQTALKFRVNTLHQKLVTYERLWQRTLHEMESGTYSRDILRARRKAEQRKVPPLPGQKAAAMPAVDDFDVDEDLPATPPAAATPGATVRAPPAPRPPSPASMLSDENVRAIFNAYVSAKKRCNEDVSRLSFDAVAANLRKQVPQLMQQHKASSVEFKVVIKDGKAVLKAVPKT